LKKRGSPIQIQTRGDRLRGETGSRAPWQNRENRGRKPEVVGQT
jgi:hypothetical protein